MAHPASREGERALANETVLRPDAVGGDTLPFLRIKVVYLGGNTKKTERLKGQVIEVRDPDHPDDPDRGLKEQSPIGYTMYDFSTVDDRGRKITTRLHHEDGRPFSPSAAARRSSCASTRRTRTTTSTSASTASPTARRAPTTSPPRSAARRSPPR